jgi:hypothetical protein
MKEKIISIFAIFLTSVTLISPVLAQSNQFFELTLTPMAKVDAILIFSPIIIGLISLVFEQSGRKFPWVSVVIIFAIASFLWFTRCYFYGSFGANGC